MGEHNSHEPVRASSYQLLRRLSIGIYGTDAGESTREASPQRPLATRNGLPVRPYRYQGTGQSMSDVEARYWLRHHGRGSA
jgi:hypothetical protein